MDDSNFLYWDMQNTQSSTFNFVLIVSLINGN